MDNCSICESRHPDCNDIDAFVHEARRILSREQMCSEKLYRQRMNICNRCDALQQSCTCSYCGCLIQIRALIKLSTCPYPGNDRWMIVEDTHVV